MSGSLKNGSVNIWSTSLGLNLAGGFNFKKQVHQEPSKVAEQVKRSYLNMKNYGGEDDNSAHMYLRNQCFEGKQPLAKEAPEEKKTEEKKAEPSQVESELFGNAFDMDEEE